MKIMFHNFAFTTLQVHQAQKETRQLYSSLLFNNLIILDYSEIYILLIGLFFLIWHPVREHWARLDQDMRLQTLKPQNEKLQF